MITEVDRDVRGPSLVASMAIRLCHRLLHYLYSTLVCGMSRGVPGPDVSPFLPRTLTLPDIFYLTLHLVLFTPESRCGFGCGFINF